MYNIYIYAGGGWWRLADDDGLAGICIYTVAAAATYHRTPCCSCEEDGEHHLELCANEVICCCVQFTRANCSYRRGRHLLTLCDTHGLIILNGRYSRSPTPPYTCQRTHASTSTNTIIDYAILTRTHVHMILTCTVLEEPLLAFSDHNPILLHLQSGPKSHAPTAATPTAPIRTLYNEHKLSTPTITQKLQASWTQALPGILTDFSRLDHQYLTTQILEQDYVDRLLTIVDDGLAKTCTTHLGLRQPRRTPPRHPFRIPNPPITPTHANARSRLLLSVRAASQLCHITPPNDPSRAQHLTALTQLHDQLRAIDTKHAHIALLKRLPTYDASITPSTPAFSIRRVTHAPLPTQLHTNSSLDKAVYILGDLTSDPHLLVTAWNECRSSMGHTLIGHPSSTWNESYTTHMLQAYSTILDDTRGPAHLRAPPLSSKNAALPSARSYTTSLLESGISPPHTRTTTH